MISVKTSAVYLICAVSRFCGIASCTSFQYKEAHKRPLIVNDFWH